MSSKKIETEAKYIIPDSATFEAIQQITQLGDFKIAPAGVKDITDRYLDTPDKRLFQAGFACRIRRSRGEQLLTLKSMVGAEDEIHRRQEIETVVESDQPRQWDESEAKNLVLDIVGQAPLETLFTLYQTRYKYQVSLARRPVIELSLDQVSLQQTATIDYLGLEAELMEAGTETDLSRFTEDLRQTWPLKADRQSKFERALARVGGSNFT